MFGRFWINYKQAFAPKDWHKTFLSLMGHGTLARVERMDQVFQPGTLFSGAFSEPHFGNPSPKEHISADTN